MSVACAMSHIQLVGKIEQCSVFCFWQKTNPILIQSIKCAWQMPSSFILVIPIVLWRLALISLCCAHMEIFLHCKLFSMKSYLTNAVSRSSAEWNIGKWMPTLCSLRQEVVGVEFFWVWKYLWVPMYHIWNNRNICPNRDSVVLWNNNPDQAQYKIQ